MTFNPAFGFNFHFDCVVVGSGHAGSCAALSAIDAGCGRGELLAFSIHMISNHVPSIDPLRVDRPSRLLSTEQWLTRRLIQTIFIFWVRHLGTFTMNDFKRDYL
jgi:hypothetical protein